MPFIIGVGLIALNIVWWSIDSQAPPIIFSVDSLLFLLLGQLLDVSGFIVGFGLIVYEFARGADHSESSSKFIAGSMMLFAAMAIFVVLGLTQVIEPINNLLAQVLEFLPRFIGAAILFLVAWDRFGHCQFNYARAK